MDPNLTGLSGREPVSGVTGAGTANEPYDQGNSADPNLGGTSARAFPQDSGSGAAQEPEAGRGDYSHGDSTYGSDDALGSSTGQGDPNNIGNANSGGYGSTSNNLSSTGSSAGTRDIVNNGSDQTGGVTNLGSNSATTSTTSRAAGEEDTATGATGAQGRNIAGDIRPHHDTEKTGVTGVYSNDLNDGNQKPSSSNEGAGRGTVGGVGVADSSVSSDTRIGQDYKQKQQGADRPNEKPSEHGINAVKERKARAEDVASGTDHPHHAAGHAADGPETESKGEGTGEKWVKTTGLAAEGGNFDAAKPGAGKEADRLLEQKGVHRSSDPKHEDNPSAVGGHGSHGSDSANKHGVGEKIKEKLHLGHHKE